MTVDQYLNQNHSLLFENINPKDRPFRTQNKKQTRKIKRIKVKK